MNRINRNNYELHFIDYLEGKLPFDLADEFNLFLEENPDLKEELELMSDDESQLLVPGNVVFSDKKQLKKPESSSLDNTNVFEQQSISRMEGDLSTEEAALFDAYIERNTTKKSEYILFTKTRIGSNQEIYYPNRNELKRFILLPLNLTQFQWLSSAAAIAIIVVFSFSLWMNFNDLALDSRAKTSSASFFSGRTSQGDLPGSHDVQISSGEPLNEPDPMQMEIETPVSQLASFRQKRDEVVPVLLTTIPSQTFKTVVMKAESLKRSMLTEFRDEPVFASIEPATLNEALTVKEYATSLFKKQILNQDEKKIDPSGIRFDEIADAIIEVVGIN